MDWDLRLLDAATPKPNRPARCNQPKGTTAILNKGVRLAAADARKQRG